VNDKTDRPIVHNSRLDPGVDLITKPFTQAALSSGLRSILDAARSPGRTLVVEDEPLPLCRGAVSIAFAAGDQTRYEPISVGIVLLRRNYIQRSRCHLPPPCGTRCLSVFRNFPNAASRFPAMFRRGLFDHRGARP
jgi:hypothetical protein